MLARRAELGSAEPAVCPRCNGEANRRRVLILTDSAIEVEPWSLVTCRRCGLVARISDVRGRT